MSFSLLSPVKDDDVDRHIIFLKEAVDRINGNLQRLVFRIAVNPRRDKRKGHCLTAMFLCKRKGGAVTGGQLFPLAIAAAPPARTYGMDYILEKDRVKNLKLHGGTYPFMLSHDIYVDGLESDSKYVFQYVKNVEIHNADITTKDAFWEVENVTIYDSRLNGEYLGWHSRNLRLVNCHISGEQPLCYAHDLVLENCTFDPSCDRAFEYSTLRADIRGTITNIKNPMSGHIVADGIGSVTIDKNIKAPADCLIEVRK